ncbi:pyridoxamine 5'-phosphate oxidase family protein [Nocardia mexicana]|uniref:Pyridoxamine 5'-phosphate oxidase n=1 Tax=Nocardia mexicana TaxID=279262 RepID=A0A370H063_9NOCA|nr:pyridoxamine 5'-phosphate oxidase family protein [Nocardia mexicana]RDI48939.1 hypothetical protein DFR68_10764 [Nocardia mexicana]
MASPETAVTDQEIRAKLADILRNSSIDLATSKDGVNWCSNAFFAVLDDDPFRLTLVLESRGRTLECVRANPNIGVKVVPEGFLQPFAQGLGTAVVRDAADRDETFEALRRKEPQIEPFLATPVEPIAVTVDWWRVTHVEGGWLPGRVLRR